MKIAKTCCYFYFLLWYCTATFCEISNRLIPCKKYSNCVTTFSWLQNFIYIVKRLLTTSWYMTRLPNSHTTVSYLFVHFSFVVFNFQQFNCWKSRRNQSYHFFSHDHFKFLYWNKILFIVLISTYYFHITIICFFSVTRWSQHYSINKNENVNFKRMNLSRYFKHIY